MRRSFFLFLYCMICLNFVHAQRNMSPGWVVLNNGDTVRGMINYKQWTINPKSIEFKAGREITYGIKDLKSFGAANEDTYQRFIITRHLLPAKDDDNIPDNEDSTVTSTEWLRMIVNARYGLAEFNTGERSYFFSIDGSTAEELVYFKGIKAYTSEKYRNHPNYGRTGFIENTRFREQLSVIAQKKDRPVPVPANLRYNAYELSGYMSKLNGLSGDVPKGSKGSWGITAGASFYQYGFSGNNSQNKFSGSVKSSISPLLAINYTVFSARALSKGGIIFDLGLTTINTTGNSTPFTDVTNEMHIKNLYVQVGAMPIYIFTPVSPVSFYAGAGLKIMALVSSDNSITEKNLTSGLVTSKKGEPNGKSMLAGLLTAGVMAGRTSYCLVYAVTGNTTNYNFYSIPSNSLSACFTIRLGR